MEDEVARVCVVELGGGDVETSGVSKVDVLGEDAGGFHVLEVTTGTVVGALGELGLVVVVGVPREAEGPGLETLSVVLAGVGRVWMVETGTVCVDPGEEAWVWRDTVVVAPGPGDVGPPVAVLWVLGAAVLGQCGVGRQQSTRML